MVKPLKTPNNIIHRIREKQARHMTRLPDPNIPKTPPTKGIFNGLCNRSACLKPGASWFNHSTRKYYCVECAVWLNTEPGNRADAYHLWGHNLCTEGEYDQMKFAKLHDLHHNAQMAMKAQINGSQGSEQV